MSKRTVAIIIFCIAISFTGFISASLYEFISEKTYRLEWCLSNEEYENKASTKEYDFLQEYLRLGLCPSGDDPLILDSLEVVVYNISKLTLDEYSEARRVMYTNDMDGRFNMSRSDYLTNGRMLFYDTLYPNRMYLDPYVNVNLLEKERFWINYSTSMSQDEIDAFNASNMNLTGVDTMIIIDGKRPLVISGNKISGGSVVVIKK